MKYLKYISLALALLLCVNVNAQRRKSKTAELKVEQKAEKVDTVPMADFSYAFGIAQTNGLLNYLVQRMGVDTTYMADFLQGFEYAEMTPEVLKLKAWVTGTEIRRQLESQILPQANRQVNDSVDLLDRNLFIQGFRSAIQGTTLIPQDSAQAIANRQLAYYHRVKMDSKYGANRTAGENFLKENAKKDSVKVTPSGLQFKVLSAGTGPVPTANQRVKVNYEGKLLDGTVFDSSYKRQQPATFGCDQVIKGWTEALTMMPVGSKWQLFIPQELAYGDREAGKIPPYSMLIFTVELLEIVQ
jgi:FKBP-type peptidyl-prolyl cis-trans isomerase FklB